MRATGANPTLLVPNPTDAAEVLFGRRRTSPLVKRAPDDCQWFNISNKAAGHLLVFASSTRRLLRAPAVLLGHVNGTIERDPTHEATVRKSFLRVRRLPRRPRRAHALPRNPA
jgi:hypothetical protein